ncbi:hypothetical protein [Pseudoroseicyclus tamaricis]|uniref:Lipoprotein n=1 Tax=Pseudoroseicyclus tamaricis TaxID=2705421 RepID=A0A6B2K156_9RHOB|nr:hypothetical protein [Pseudoroseicyclus tamaricis]NDV02164.1 hypothetical protein [Pseudoroseicyclus tamaricis]
MRGIIAAACAAAILTGCADPLADLGRYDEATVPAGTATADLVAPQGADSGLDFFQGAIEDGAAAAEEAASRPAATGGGFLASLFAAVPAVPAVPPSDSPTIAPGTELPWGHLATVCGLPDSEMGTRVGASSGYELWDSEPGSAQPRTFYITGFGNDCARQVTASLAMFGDVGTHEMVRYMTPEAVLPMTPTARAYEAIKASVCRVAAGTPCGSDIERLGQRTTFMTLYANLAQETFANILLSDGSVAATDF